MELTTRIIGLKRLNPVQHGKMVAAFNACRAAMVELPPQITEYFGSNVNINAPVKEVDLTVYAKSYSALDGQGLQLNIDSLDSDIKVIRFINSYQESKT